MRAQRGIDALWTAGAASADAAAAFAGARHFDTVDELLARAARRRPLRRRSLVKGSRFMQMERVVAALLALPSNDPAASDGDRACCLAWPNGCRPLSPEFGFFRVFQYLTFRAVMAAMTSLLIGLAFGPWVIRRLQRLKIGQPIRDYGVADAPGQERHADDGRRADPDRHRRLDAAVVRLEQPLRLDRDAGDVRLRRDRLDRRLAQGRAARTPKACARARSTSGSR